MAEADANATPVTVQDPNAASIPAAAAPAAAPPPDVNQAAAANVGADAATPKMVPTGAAAPGTAPAPHSRLLAMVRGLAQGLQVGGATLQDVGTELATHGEKQGQALNQLKTQKIQAQQASIAAREADTRMKLMTFQVAEAQAHINQLLQSIPLEHEETVTRLAGLKQTQAIEGADFAATHGGMDAAAFTAAMKEPASVSTGAAPAAPAAVGAAPSSNWFMAGAQRTLRAAMGSGLTAENPAVKNMQDVLASPNATKGDLYRATTQLAAEQESQNKATTEATAKQTLVESKQKSDPLFKYQSDPKALSDPGAQAALTAYIKDPANAGNLDGITHAKSLIPLADIAQKHDRDLAALKIGASKAAEQAAAAGNPADAGRLMVSGDLTLADLKSRGSTPGQIIAATDAAKKYAADHGTTYNASDEIVGEHTLSQPGQQVFFGSARSLVQRNGMLDQLKAAHDALGNTKIPAYNTYMDWRNYQAGTPELATFRTAVLGSADDAAKVMGGGTPTDQLRDMFMQTFQSNINNLGFAGAIKQARDSVRSQVTGRIGQNGYIARREGDILTDHQVGDIVTVNGTQIKISAINPKDGSFTGDPVAGK